MPFKTFYYSPSLPTVLWLRTAGLRPLISSATFSILPLRAPSKTRRPSLEHRCAQGERGQNFSAIPLLLTKLGFQAHSLVMETKNPILDVEE